jgi:hypothetical protein
MAVQQLCADSGQAADQVVLPQRRPLPGFDALVSSSQALSGERGDVTVKGAQRGRIPGLSRHMEGERDRGRPLIQATRVSVRGHRAAGHSSNPLVRGSPVADADAGARVLDMQQGDPRGTGE